MAVSYNKIEFDSGGFKLPIPKLHTLIRYLIEILLFCSHTLNQLYYRPIPAYYFTGR